MKKAIPLTLLFTILIATALLWTGCATIDPPGANPSAADPEVRQLLQDVRKRMTEPYMLGGDDVERLYARAESILRRKGDARFATALTAEPPKSVNALREFFGGDLLLESYPKTRTTLRAAPRSEWPAAIATGRPKPRP